MSRWTMTEHGAGWGRTIAGIWLYGPEHVAILLRAVEGSMRAGDTSPELQQWRLELLNMRWRAYTHDWLGWER